MTSLTKTFALLLTAVLAGLLGACGGGQVPTAPATPTQAPTPAFPAGFVHVMANGQLTTYRIDRPTGRLDPVSSQVFTQSLASSSFVAMAGDPRGRAVYLGNVAESPGAIVTFVPNPSTGVLSPAAAVVGTLTTASWGSLMVGSDHLVGLRSAASGRHTYSWFENHRLDEAGLVREELARLDTGDGCYGGGAVVDWRQGSFYYSCYGTLGYSLKPDGRFQPEHELRECGPSTAPVPAYSLAPRAAVRGMVLASALVDQQETTCSYDGPDLDPRANLGIAVGRAATFDPADASRPAQIALGVVRNEQGTTVSDLRLYSVGPGAQLHLQDSKSRGDMPVAFHPLGRLLFASNVESNPQNPYDYRYQLVVYAFEPEGRLTEIQRIDQAAGWLQVAVTFPSSSN